MKEKMIPLLGAAVLIGVTFFMFSGNKGERKMRQAGEIKMPVLSAVAKDGQALFTVNCSICHGTNAGGTIQGPPLIHKYYETSHHGDGAFYQAAARGVRAHHWRFGNMPPIPTVNEQDVTKIIAFVREVQRANGIN